MSDQAVPDSHTGAHDALAVGWALHTLDHEEEADFAAHLGTCPTCRQTVDETLETLGELAEAVVPVSPPRHLRRRLLDAVAAESAASGEGIDLPALSGAPVAEPAEPGPAPEPAAEEREATVVPLSPRRRASRWLAVAAVALVVAAVGGLAVANQSLRTERDNAAPRRRPRPSATPPWSTCSGTPAPPASRTRRWPPPTARSSGSSSTTAPAPASSPAGSAPTGPTRSTCSGVSPTGHRGRWGPSTSPSRPRP